MACWTVVIFSASSSGISHSNSSSSAITSSTVSRESAPRSLTNDDSFLTSASLTPSCSATIFFTRCSIFSIWFPSGVIRFLCKKYFTKSRARHLTHANHRLIHQHSAIDMQGGTGDISGSRSRQKCNRPGDVLDGAEPGERNLCHEYGALNFFQFACHVGIDKARRDAIYRYVAAADFACERLAEADHAGFRSRIIGLPRVAHDADDRRNVDDAAVARFHHRADHEFRQPVDRLQI